MYPVQSLYVEKGLPKNFWFVGIADAISQADAAKNYSDGRIEFMHVDKQDALYTPQTKQMRIQNETQAAIDIVEWFSNENLRFTPDVEDWNNNPKKYGRDS